MTTATATDIESRINTGLRAATDDPAAFLGPTHFMDCDSPVVRDFARHHAGALERPMDKVLALYLAVRDGIRYDPYSSVLIRDNFRASRVIEAGRAFCVTKSVLMAAACRALGVPARPGYADVTNHLASPRLLDIMGSNLFVWHSYTEVFLNGEWIKCTPVFNADLCQKFNVAPLEFDGRDDSLFQPHDVDGNTFMNYVHDHGPYAELPYEAIEAAFIAEMPNAYGPRGHLAEGGDFYEEADAVGASG